MEVTPFDRSLIPLSNDTKHRSIQARQSKLQVSKHDYIIMKFKLYYIVSSTDKLHEALLYSSLLPFLLVWHTHRPPSPLCWDLS